MTPRIRRARLTLSYLVGVEGGFPDTVTSSSDKGDDGEEDKTDEDKDSGSQYKQRLVIGI